MFYRNRNGDKVPVENYGVYIQQEWPVEEYTVRENYSDQQNRVILMSILGGIGLLILIVIIILLLKKGKKGGKRRK